MKFFNLHIPKSSHHLPDEPEDNTYANLLTVPPNNAHFFTGGDSSECSSSEETSETPVNTKFTVVKMSQDAEDGPETLFREAYISTNQYFLNATRLPMNQDEFDNRFHYERPKNPHNEFIIRGKKFLRHYYTPLTDINELRKFLASFIPILTWLPSYEWRINFVPDIIGGLTVGVMHVPQGIAYAILAGVDPVVGLYTSFFPPLFYMFFGTSRHNSIGSFAVVSLMAGIAVEKFSLPISSSSQSQAINGTDKMLIETEQNLPPEIIASLLALVIGLIQILMGLVRLEIITTYFSDQLISGFTTAASCHVFASQLKDLFGIKELPRRSGFGYLFLRFYDVVTHIRMANIITMSISVCALSFLLIGKELVNPFLKNRFRNAIPIPWELLLLIISTFFSWCFHFHSNYDVAITSSIPTGLPMPSWQRFDLIPELIERGFIQTALSIAVVVLAVHISLAKMFGKKMNYRVDPGQEFYALGLSSVFSSLFPVYPVSCSLGRTMVNVEAGTKTQFSTISSTILLGAIILYFGYWLRTLPMCILSSIVIVALKNIFKRCTDLCRFWSLSKIDFSIWFVSFVATFIWGVSEGLAISISYALLTTVFRTQWPRWHYLSNLIATNDFRDSERYLHTTNHPGVCIFRFDSPLLFTNVDRFKANIRKAFAMWDARARLERRKSLTSPDISKIFVEREANEQATRSLDIPSKPSNLKNKFERNVCFRHFVIDCSGFTFVDYMGVNALKEIFTEMRNKKVLLYFASAKAPVRDLFEKCGFYQYVPKHNFYPTIRDAVAIARKRRNASTMKLLEEHVDQFDAISEAVNTQPMD